jgi:hypothetical protein
MVNENIREWCKKGCRGFRLKMLPIFCVIIGSQISEAHVIYEKNIKGNKRRAQTQNQKEL